MPGLAVTVGRADSGSQESVGGEKVAARIRREPDPVHRAQIVAGWPRKFAANRALQFGFKADTSFEQIIRILYRGRARRQDRVTVLDLRSLQAPKDRQ